ncbi:actin-related protein ARPC3, partial [Rhodotorula toruloides]
PDAPRTIPTPSHSPYTPAADPSIPDIIDESLQLFRANSLFRNFEIKTPADRALIYLILFIGDCLGRIAQARTWTHQDALKQLTTHSLSHFSLPGEPGFPLNQVFTPPSPPTPVEKDALRSWLVQARQETVVRLLERHVYSAADESTEGGKRPSKWWMAFSVSLRVAYYEGSRNSSAPYGTTCKHGDRECRGNVQQLCAERYWGAESAWEFIQCLNYDPNARVGNERAARECGRLIGRDWTKQLQQCVEGEEGRKLARQSAKRLSKLRVEKSCSILVRGEVVCIHDSTWQRCPSGHEVGDFKRLIEREWERENGRGR